MKMGKKEHLLNECCGGRPIGVIDDKQVLCYVVQVTIAQPRREHTAIGVCVATIG